MNADELRSELVGLLPRLRRFAHALTGTRHDADDLLQSTIERVLDKGIPEAVAVDRWAFRVCRNIWIDEIRSRKVRNPVSLDDSVDEAEMAVDGERSVMGKMALEEIGRAMDALPEEQRSALALVVLEGCSYAEAAEILGSPIGTIMSRIARARSALAVALRGDATQGGGTLATGVRG